MSFCLVSLACLALYALVLSITKTCCSIFSSISSVRAHSLVESAEKVGTISENTFQISHADIPLPGLYNDVVLHPVNLRKKGKALAFS